MFIAYILPPGSHHRFPCYSALVREPRSQDTQLSVDLSVDIGGLRLRNPIIAASGCFGYGVEYADLVDLSTLGGVAVKGYFLMSGKATPRRESWETPSGMLNAIGLQGIGVRRFVAEKLPLLRAHGAVVIVNICGSTIDEYAEVARI